MMQEKPGIILIGGSWGGIQASQSILRKLPANYPVPILLILHRQRNVDSDLRSVFAKKLSLKVCEVEEKESLHAGVLYIAPANYHVLLESDATFSLDSSELQNFSRPSIDVTFSSAASIFRKRCMGIILSGASKDGSQGLKDIYDRGGSCLVQDPRDAEVATMPEAAIRLVPECWILSLKNIEDFLISIS